MGNQFYPHVLWKFFTAFSPVFHGLFTSFSRSFHIFGFCIVRVSFLLQFLRKPWRHDFHTTNDNFISNTFKTGTLTAAILQTSGTLTSSRQHFFHSYVIRAIVEGINMRFAALHVVTQSWCWWEVLAILRSFQPRSDDLLDFFVWFHFLLNPDEVRFPKLRWARSGRKILWVCDDVMEMPLHIYYLIISLARDPYAICVFQHAAACGIHMDVHDCWSTSRCLIRTWPLLSPSRKA